MFDVNPFSPALDPIVSVVTCLREFRPVQYCNANNMAAMVLLGEVKETQDELVIVAGTIVPHRTI